MVVNSDGINQVLIEELEDRNTKLEDVLEAIAEECVEDVQINSWWIRDQIKGVMPTNPVQHSKGE